MIIVPAIDVIDGTCVRLRQGDYLQKSQYSRLPLAQAKCFEAAGLTHLHLVDLDGAKAGRIENEGVLESIATQTSLKVDVGGGLHNLRSVQTAFDLGTAQVNIGSLAVRSPEAFLDILNRFGADKVILSADVLGEKIALNAWQEQSSFEILQYIQEYVRKGLQYVVVTDITKDGMLQGPAFDLYAKIIRQSTVKLIASGGISSVDDLKKLADIGCYGAIVGKAYYEGKITLEELANLNTA